MPKESKARSLSLTSQSSCSSAVIIADLIADVPNRCSPIKEETNLEKKPAISNGSNISKGVLLNAVQFGQNDPKLPPPTIVQKGKPFTEEFKEMSSLRKVAFGLSFLPSLMFVLCFAVIFPCERILPCVDMDWWINLNGTEVTSHLLAPQNLLFTFSNDSGFGIRSVKESSGGKLWENILTSPPKFLECANLEYTDKQSCLVIDNIGSIHLFDPIDGRKSTELKLNRSISSVTTLPDCDGDGLEEIAVATSHSEIRIVSIKNILVTDCDTVPSLLMSWRKQNKADLIFTCQKGQNEILVRVSQEEWCNLKSNHPAKMSTLKSEKAGILSQSTFLSATDGLVLWTHDFVTMFAHDGHELWSVPSHNHSSKNRYLLHGKTRTDEKEIILLSSELSSNLQITRLDAKNGITKQAETKPHLEISEAVIINGEESDFILGLKKKIHESLPSKAVSRINEMSSSVINILTNEEATLAPSSSKVIEEISLMELDGKDVKTIHTQELSAGESYISKFTVVLKKKEKNKSLQLFVLRKPEDKDTELPTTVKSIKISNWDTSSEKTSYCAWQ